MASTAAVVKVQKTLKSGMLCKMSEDLLCLGNSGFNQLKPLATNMAAITVQCVPSVTTDYSTLYITSS